MKIRYIIRSIIKPWLITDSEARRAYRMVGTRFRQACSEVFWNMHGAAKILGLQTLFWLSRTFDPYKVLSLLTFIKAETGSRMEVLGGRFGRVLHARNEKAAELRAFEEPETEKKGKKNKKQSQEKTRYQAQASEDVPHNIPDEEKETFLSRSSAEDNETAILKFIRDLNDKTRQFFIHMQREYLIGTVWLKFPKLAKHVTEYITPSSKKTVVSYVSKIKLLIYCGFAVYVEANEVTHITDMVTNAFGAEGIKRFLYGGLPLGLGTVLGLMNIKSMRSWLCGGIRNSWRRIPAIIWLAAIFGICALASASLTASDEDKISENLDEKEANDPGLTLDDLIEDEAPEQESEIAEEENAKPERMFTWSPVANYLLFAFTLAFTTAVLISSIYIFSQYLKLKHELKQLNKELESIQKEYEKLRLFLDNFRVTYERTLGLLGAIQLLELIISGTYTTEEVELITRPSFYSSNNDKS